MTLAPSSTLIVKAGTLVDGTGAPPRRGAQIVIRGGRIVEVGPIGDAPSDAQVIDASSHSVVPGLVDCHVHLIAPGNGLDFAHDLATPPSLAVLRMAAHLRATLDAGFTTVRDAGGGPFAVSRAVEEGTVEGPRVQVAVSILAPTGGHVDGRTASGAELGVRLADVPPSLVDGPEAVRQRVRQVMRAGAHWVKVCASGGVVSASPHDRGFTAEELAAAVDEAAGRGRRVMAHAHTGPAIEAALAAGAASIEHGVWLPDEAIQTMVDRGVFLVPTLAAPGWVRRHAADGRMPAEAAEAAASVEADHAASVARAAGAGVRLAYGTDTGIGPHGTNGQELAALVDAGLTPMAAITSATATAAQLLGWSDRLGTLEAGKLGDVIAVEGDPLADIGVLGDPRRVVLVLKEGRIVKDLRCP
jgi:imidazolonepropionase-like amidohydrolase